MSALHDFDGSPAHRDSFWEAAKQLGKLIAKEAIAKREARKARRRETARKYYARRKAAGTLPKKAEKVEEYYEVPTTCYCSTCRMPPCSWCTRECND